MNKTKRLFLRLIAGGIALFILIVIIVVVRVWISRPDYIEPDTSQWHTGDIFFSVGDSWESVAVRALTGGLTLEVADSTPSHCGVVVRDAGGVKLIHASTTAGRVVGETPLEYFTANGSYCLYALRPPCPVDTAALRHVADSLVAEKIPFDFNFDHTDTSALYCTEMVVRTFHLSGQPCFSHLLGHKHIYPEAIRRVCLGVKR